MANKNLTTNYLSRLSNHGRCKAGDVRISVVSLGFTKK